MGDSNSLDTACLFVNILSLGYFPDDFPRVLGRETRAVGSGPDASVRSAKAALPADAGRAERGHVATLLSNHPVDSSRRSALFKYHDSPWDDADKSAINRSASPRAKCFSTEVPKPRLPWWRRSSASPLPRCSNAQAPS